MKNYIALIVLVSASVFTLRTEDGTCVSCNKRPVPQHYNRKNVCYDTNMLGSVESGTNARLTDESSTMENKYCEG